MGDYVQSVVSPFFFLCISLFMSFFVSVRQLTCYSYAPFSCQSTADTCMMILDWKQTLEFPAEDECDITDTAIDLICK